MNNYGVGLARSRATPDVPPPSPGITPQLQRHATLHYVSRTQTTLWCTFSKSARQIRLNERSGSGARLLDSAASASVRAPTLGCSQISTMHPPAALERRAALPVARGV